MLGLLPARTTLIKEVRTSMTHTTSRSHITCSIQRRALGHTDCVGTRGSGDANGIWVILRSTLDAITRRQESIEALDEGRVTVEEGRHALNDAWRIDAAGGSDTPHKIFAQQNREGNSRLTLKIFHYVQEPVIHIRLVDEPNLHLVEIAERILRTNTVSKRSHSTTDKDHPHSEWAVDPAPKPQHCPASEDPSH